MTNPESTQLRLWATDISAVTLLVADLAATREFYISTFGLPIVFEDDNCAVFQFKNTLINLLKESAGEELLAPEKVAQAVPGARFVLTLPVDDVDATCAELASRGVALLNGPMDRPWGIRTASFKDPAGYVWEISRNL
jgi:catechol 2,3-dioxygenase-like lactoylglutathione lyase family enzyme